MMFNCDPDHDNQANRHNS